MPPIFNFNFFLKDKFILADANGIIHIIDGSSPIGIKIHNSQVLCLLINDDFSLSIGADGYFKFVNLVTRKVIDFSILNPTRFYSNKN